MESCLYEGLLRHRRYSPRAHEFSYPLFMLYLDLAELDTIFYGKWLWSTQRPTLVQWRRADHFGQSTVSLDLTIRNLVEQETGNRPVGSIRLLTHPRYFGYGFNPVSLFYCLDATGKPETIVAEVNNTPWGERHCYVLSSPLSKKGRVRQYLLKKALHVSPFMPMEVDYDWCFTGPDEHLSVHMQNYCDGQVNFDATLSLERKEISSASLAAVLIRYPLMTTRVITAIYWQSFLLWLKGCPIYTHPKKSEGEMEI